MFRASTAIPWTDPASTAALNQKLNKNNHFLKKTLQHHIINFHDHFPIILKNVCKKTTG